MKPGVDYLIKHGPSSKDAVYNLYATIYVHQADNQAWDTWNHTIRMQLVKSQVKEGDEDGSWYSADDVDAAEGGRLFQTVMSTLTLEVYYRYLPLFK
jgi:hypothetical protein